MNFAFQTDDHTKYACEEIVGEMVKLFGISTDEAIARINEAWDGLSIIGPDDLIFHETTGYWAHNIYYGKDSRWWLFPEGLEPRPYKIR